MAPRRSFTLPTKSRRRCAYCLEALSHDYRGMHAQVDVHLLVRLSGGKEAAYLVTPSSITLGQQEFCASGDEFFYPDNVRLRNMYSYRAVYSRRKRKTT